MTNQSENKPQPAGFTTQAVTEADRGEVIKDSGILTKVTMTKSPTQYDYDYLSFEAYEGRPVFNMHVATSAVSVDSVLFSGLASFENLVLKNIPAGCEVELEFADPPTLTSISPDTAVSGENDFTLVCTGTNFVPGTVIRFGPTHDEDTTFVSETEVTTIVKPSLFAPAVVPVAVHSGEAWSDWVDFTFTEPAVEGQPAEE
jgi:hypothetical protein